MLKRQKVKENFGGFMSTKQVYDNVRLDSLERLSSAQAVVEARLVASSGSAIAKVLSVAADCTGVPAEVFAGECRYSGKVSFKVVYADEIGQNHSLDYVADFTDKLVSGDIKAGIKPVVLSEILDTEIVSVDTREIKLACVVETTLLSCTSTCMDILLDASEGIYTSKDNICYTQNVMDIKECHNITDTLAVEGVSKVLLCESSIVVKGKHADIDTVSISGFVVSYITYCDNENMIKSTSHKTPFSYDIACEKITDESLVTVSASIDKYSCVYSDESDNQSIDLEYDIVLLALGFNKAETTCVTNAFSVTNELTLAGESVKVCRDIYNINLDERVEGSVTLDINMPIVDNILAVTGSKVNISSVVASLGTLTYEGVVSLSIIYYSAEKDTKSSVAVELPFSFTTNAECTSNDEFVAKAVVSGVKTKIRRGNEIDIKADIEIEFCGISYDDKFVITSLELGEERELPTSAFSVYIAKGDETLWELARELGTTPESIKEQNANLNLPLTAGDKVIAYRHISSKR